MGEEIFISVSIGNCFQVFRFNKLTSCLVSKTTPGSIRCMMVQGDETYVAVERTIFVFKRSEIVHKYNVHTTNIAGLTLIGTLLISHDNVNNIIITDVKDRSCIAEMKLLQPSTIACIIHPATYVNKILIGYRNGQLELWNINKKALIYTIASHLQFFKARNIKVNAITCLEQSPACDVIAIGFNSGDILLLNLKLDQVLFAFTQTGSVTSLSFRTDAKAKHYPYLVSASTTGILSVWSLGTKQNVLEETATGSNLVRSLQSTIDAHKGNIARVAFLPGEPIMVSSGEDNCLRVWIFDSPDGSARLHSCREGHSGCPNKIRYYGGSSQVSMRDNADASSCEVVSAGSDGTLRLFNTAISNQNREFSQKPILKSLGLLRRNELLPNCIGYDFSENKERHWGNLVSIHENQSNAFVWKYKQRVISEIILKPPERHDLGSAGHCSSVAFSLCGNFCIVGYRNGLIYKYNVQSGQCRGSYPSSTVNGMKAGTVIQRAKLPANVMYGQILSNSTMQNSLNGHTQDVTGLFVDMTNSTLVSCGLDGKVSFWDFNNQNLLHQVVLNSPLQIMQGFRDANFVAISDQARTTYVFDVQSFKLIRKYSGHSQHVTDIAFSPDGRRLLTSSMDCTVRIWEISTSRCLSWLKFSRPVLSIAISLSGEYLIVAQAEKNGIFMYADRSLYETVHFWKEPISPTLVDDSEMVDDDSADSSDSVELSGLVKVPDDLENEVYRQTDLTEILVLRNSENIVAFSSSPRVFWSSLFHLESIKERNTLATPVSAAPTAPFFLPTVVRGDSSMSFPTKEEYVRMMNDSRKQSFADDDQPSKFAKLDVSNEEVPSDGLFDMKSAWSDDDGFSNFNDIAVVESTEDMSTKRSQSRILTHSSTARCKLISLLLKLKDFSLDSTLLDYLKSLSAPAVDVEISALCTSDIEMQESLIISEWLSWLSRMVCHGRDFELIQAYLHRTLVIYSEMVLKSPTTDFVAIFESLKTNNAITSNSFRTNIQRNLCMLKVLANIPLN